MENKVMEASGAKNLIEVKNLTKKFGELLVLDDISENIRLGERVAIIGPSGSGKSTFLRCLNVLEDPTAGRIFFDGVDLADRKVNINEHREKMGMVFQQFNLFNNLTVKKNITLAPVKIGTRAIRRYNLGKVFLPLYNAVIGLIAPKYNDALSRKRAAIEAKIAAGKTFATYDEKLTAEKLKITAKIEKCERKLAHAVELTPKEIKEPKFLNVKALKAHAEADAMRLLERIGLKDKADVYPSTLSGGQKQRIAIVERARSRDGGRGPRPHTRASGRRNDYGHRHPRNGICEGSRFPRDVHGRRENCRTGHPRGSVLAPDFSAPQGISRESALTQITRYGNLILNIGYRKTKKESETISGRPGRATAFSFDTAA